MGAEQAGVAALKPDLARVKEIRESQRCSLFEAQHLALVEKLEGALSRAVTVDDLRPVLATLIGKLRPSL